MSASPDPIMTRPLELAALSLGGLSFFTVAFLGFAVTSGVPLHSIAVIGPLFPPSEEPEQEVERVSEGSLSELEVIQANRGVLAAYQIPPPFSGEELQELSQELRNARARQSGREESLDAREQELVEREEAVDSQLTALERMRDVLEAEAVALELRAEEVSRDEQVEATRNLGAWKKRAELFKGASAKKVVDRLMEYEPDEAAILLQLLDTKTANELLSAIDKGRWKAYQDAYAEAPPLPR